MACRHRPILAAFVTVLVLVAGSLAGVPAQEPPPFQLQVAHSPSGMVTAGQPLATWAGVQMLEAGGNAADAAVAAAFAIAVVEPTMNGIGGRNQILLRLPNGKIRGIDGTTQVPASYDPRTAREATYGYAVIGVPGAVAGLIRLQSEYGTLPLETVMAPAIRFARDGFRVNRLEAAHFASRVEQAAEFRGTRMHFLKPDGSSYVEGDLMVNEALAATLEAIAGTNGEAFYRGELAERMAADIQANGGVVTRESLEEYRAEDAFIVRGSYRGHEVVGSHNPSAGSLAILALHILEHFDLAAVSPAERAARVGLALGMAAEDWDFHGTRETAVRLTSKEWAARRAQELEARLQAGELVGMGAPHATWDLRGSGSVREAVAAGHGSGFGEGVVGRLGPGWETGGPEAGGAGSEERPGEGLPPQSGDSHTTHLSVADPLGMVVSLTQTLGPTWGSRVATPGLGFLYATTLGGYLGDTEPGQRASSNICPFMVFHDGEPLLVLGASGGAMIPVAVVNAVVHFVDGGLSFPEAVAAPRVAADRTGGVVLETHDGAGFTAELAEAVRALGLEVREDPRVGAFGRIHGIRHHSPSGLWEGVADPDWGGSALGLGPTAKEGPGEVHDVLIRNGMVLDGTGSPWFRADVALRGDRIAAVGDLSHARGLVEIDATGLMVAPGFIDTHTHAGGGLATEGLSHALPLLAQGITMVLVNPDGRSPLDLAAQREALLRHGLGVNVGQMVGHGSLREAVMGMEDRLATPEELEKMKSLLRAGLEEGAWGLSAGPFYTPGSYSDTREHVELGKVAAEFGVPYQSHVRDEADYTIGVVAAVEEVITVAREAGIPGVLTHAKVLGPNVWGFSHAIVHRIERAREEGVEVWADQYPYPASSTSLAAALLPRWAQVGGQDALMARLDDPATRARIRAEVVENLARRGGAHRIQLHGLRQDPSLAGRLLSEVAEERGVDPVDLSMEYFRTGAPGIVSFNMHEMDIRTFMVQPWTMTSSDGDLVPWMEGVPHPRGYGAFSRKIRHYVLDEGVVGLASAIRSMTSLPALVYRIPGRGLLKEGMAADVVVFDLETLRDKATFTEPHQLSEGMVHVFVNGRAAIRDREATGELAGRVLRKER
jgi:N-acyl-D-amino-acid deacylase